MKKSGKEVPVKGKPKFGKEVKEDKTVKGKQPAKPFQKGFGKK